MLVIHFPTFNLYKENLNSKQAQSESVWSSLWGGVRPQAQERADTIGPLWGLVASIVGYIGYAVVMDLQKHWPTIEEARALYEPSQNEVEPHADDKQEVEENVMFNDTKAGPLEEITYVEDPLRSAPLNTDATLDNFFSRPINIHTQEWGVGLDFSFKIDPWSLYFNNPRVINRISNYKLMKADLHVKIMLNGNAFHYGRILVSYNPLRLQDNMTVDRAFIDADLVEATQRPHIWLNPTTSQGGEMKLPFFFYKNLIDIVATDWSEMGELDAHSVQGLKHANGAVDTVTINVFAWAENVQFSIPTQVNPGSISPQALEIEPQADEYQSKPVSRIAGSVAKMAGMMTAVPFISPFARATEIGAQAVGAIATLFGYSSPVNPENEIFTPRPKAGYANTNVMSDAQKLTVDLKQELSIDPRTVGLEPKDQLTISSIATRESWLDSFTWALTTAPEVKLWNCIVDPSLHVDLFTEKHLPALAFASLPFKYWRGSLKFRFMVTASGYHKGRLKIVYDPEGNVDGSEYNTAYTTLIDISDEMDFTIDVGWGQATTWRQHYGLTGNLIYGSGDLTYTSSTTDLGNGTLSVYVVNELTVPNTAINNDIEINVFVSGGEDYEVCVPTDDYIKKLRLTSQSQTTVPQAMEIEPHSMEDTDDVTPTRWQAVNTMANKTEISDPSALFHFGEAIASFRQVLKRFQLYTFFAPGNLEGAETFDYIMPHFPMTPGYVANATATTLPNQLLGTDRYNYVNMTLMRYVSSAYAGMRGGVRYTIDTSPAIKSSASSYSMPSGYVRRNLEWDTPGFNQGFIPDVTTTGAMGTLLNRNEKTLDGAALIVSQVNPLTTVELPYYSEYRFKPAKTRDVPTVIDDRFQTSWTTKLSYQTTLTGDEWLPVHIAAGEDFTCFWYLGPPIFYDELDFPTS